MILRFDDQSLQSTAQAFRAHGASVDADVLRTNWSNMVSTRAPESNTTTSVDGHLAEADAHEGVPDSFRPNDFRLHLLTDFCEPLPHLSVTAYSLRLLSGGPGLSRSQAPGTLAHVLWRAKDCSGFKGAANATLHNVAEVVASGANALQDALVYGHSTTPERSARSTAARIARCCATTRPARTSRSTS